jgi:hypothetical protein
MAPKRSLTSGDNRVARLARWLKQLPSGEQWTDLRIETKQSGEWSHVQSYARRDVLEALAEEIDALLVSVANECGEFLTARAVWFNPAADQYWTAFPMRVHPEDMAPGMAYTGEINNAFIQTQTHLEAMAKLHVGGFGSAIRALETSNSQQSEINNDLRDTNHELRARLAQLEEDNANLSRELEAATELLEELEKQKPANDQNAQIINLATHAIQAQLARGARP